MTTTRKQYTPNFKAWVAIEAIREDAEPTGFAVQGASDPDREVEEGRHRAASGAFRVRADKEGCGCRDRERRAL